jgi:hypothetical protein
MSRNPLFFTTLLLSLALPVFANPQQGESLGDVARQLRAQQESNPRKATKVFTNDNLPEPKPGEAISSLPLPPEPPSPTGKSTAKPGGPPPVEQTGDKPKESAEEKLKTREYWQDRFKAARTDVAKAKELLQLSEDELSLLQIQQVRELDSMTKDELAAKVQAKQSEVDVNKATTDAVQRTLDDLDKEFKESGAPEDWSQTD